MSRKIKNGIKNPGNLVWFKDKISMITSQWVGPKFLILDNVHKVKREEVKLVRIGELIVYKKEGLTELPDRCQNVGVTKITFILDNGLIGYDKMMNEGDTTSYGYFERYINHKTL